MKYKTLLSAVLAVAVLNIGEAKAVNEDITSPMYLPNEMETLSETSLAYQRTKFEDYGAKEDLIARETLTFGIGEYTSIWAGIGNRFNTKGLTNQDYNNNHNFDYELGLKRNARLFNDLLMQVGVSYYTFSPRSWYGHSGEAKDKIRDVKGNTRWYKALRGDVKLATELENGLMPYASFGVDGNIDDSDRDLYYTAFAGIHKLENNFAYDAGLRYEFQFGSDDVSAWYMQGSADYFLNDRMTLGAYLDYQFADSSYREVDYGYTAEARFRILV